MFDQRFLYYNTSIVTHPTHESLPGIAAFKKFFRMYPRSSVFIDRSGTVTTPVKTMSLYPIPALVPFTKTYAQLCHERAVELLQRADTLDSPLYVAWSGGIDSTTVLTALLYNATPGQRARIIVLLTSESIAEYADFYARFIRGQLTCDSASLFPYLMGTNAMIVGGEANDQLFGSDISAKLMTVKGLRSIHEPYSHDTFIEFFHAIVQDTDATARCVELIERLTATAPVDLVSNYDVLWWLSFCVKWQFVNTRMLPYTTKRHLDGITHNYLGNRYDQFFNTDTFQLWSMSNLDKKIKDTWSTYKWPAKDFIFDFTRDADYQKNKQKRGSLSAVLQQQRSANFIDSDLKCYHELDASVWYEPKNDFV